MELEELEKIKKYGTETDLIRIVEEEMETIMLYQIKEWKTVRDALQ